MIYSLSPQKVAVWSVFLPDFVQQQDELIKLLDSSEQQRAARFHFAIHRERFIVARAVLRKILSLYTGIAPEEISFVYGEHGKPYLKDNPLNLQFNMSHSHERAVYAVTQEAEVGIDIEKIEPEFREDVAKRFFSTTEYTELMQLPDDLRISAFYEIWVRKEAIIKLFGKGLYQPLNEFSVKCNQPNEKIMMNSIEIYLQRCESDLFYPVVLAAEKIHSIDYHQWKN